MRNKNNKMNIVAIVLGVLLGLTIFLGPRVANTADLSDPKNFYLNALDNAKRVPYMDFIEVLNSGTVDTVYYCQTNEVMVYTVFTEESKLAKENGQDYVYPMESTYTTDYPANTDFRLSILSAGVGLTRIVLDEQTTLLQLLPSYLLVIIVGASLFLWVKMANPVDKMNEHGIAQTSNVTFDDIIGLDETKDELDIIINLIKNTINGNNIGATVPHGILLSGPPGVGKTMIAKAVANACGIPFINAAGSDFQEIYVGTGAKRVRELFRTARKKAPCIVFIDEFDAIGVSRASHAANSEDRKTINAFLKELDGFSPLEGVFILAATNYPEMLDRAVVRSGRFDREIAILPPKDWQARAKLFEHYLKDKAVSDDVNIESIAKTLTGYTGADIAAVCNEAALVALGKGESVITHEYLETAIDKKIFKGNYSKRKACDEDMKLVAYHEAGHAVASILLGNKVQRASIRSTTSGVGGAVFGSDTDSQFTTRNDMKNDIKIALAGRAAEEIFFKDITGGASSDIMKVTKLLEQYICNLGFCDEIGYVAIEGIGFKENPEVELKMRELSKELYSEVKDLLSENKDMVTRLAEELLVREVMSGREINDFFTEVPLVDSVKQEL